MNADERKRLVRLTIAGCVLIVAGYFGFPLLNRQETHLRAVRQHITNISPQWDAFRVENPEYRYIQLFGYTASDGMFGASGFVSSTQEIERLEAFMRSTMPPRPVSVGLVRVMDLSTLDTNAPAEPAEP